jgi:hypothetical protein
MLNLSAMNDKKGLSPAEFDAALGALVGAQMSEQLAGARNLAQSQKKESKPKEPKASKKAEKSDDKDAKE